MKNMVPLIDNSATGKAPLLDNSATGKVPLIDNSATGKVPLIDNSATGMSRSSTTVPLARSQPCMYIPPKDRRIVYRTIVVMA